MTQATKLLEQSMDERPLPSAATTYRISVPKASIAPRNAALTGALVPTGDGTFDFRGYRLTGTGLHNRDGGSEADWVELGGVLRALEGSLQWLIGDWIVAGELRWGKTYEDICELTGYEYGTVRNYAYVARNVDLSIRSDKLSHGHHALVAPIADAQLQQQWLQYAADHRLSVARLRAEMRAAAEEAQHQISQTTDDADRPTPLPPSPPAPLPEGEGREEDVIRSFIAESSVQPAQPVQMALWSDVDWRGWRQGTQRLANAARGKLTLTREQLLKEIEVQRKLLDALERKAREE